MAPPSIHDLQRPLKSGRKSFRKVMETMYILSSFETEISVRTTITRYNYTSLKDVIDIILPFGVKHLLIETVFPSGRAIRKNVERPPINDLLDNIIDLIDYAKRKGITVNYPGASFGILSHTFCKAGNGNFCITPEGFVSACYEALFPTKKMDIFIFGKYDENTKKIFIDHQKLQALNNRTVENIQKCAHCFAKYHCGGGCLIHAFKINGNLFVPDEYSCKIIRGIIKKYIMDMFEIKLNYKINEEKIIAPQASPKGERN